MYIWYLITIRNISLPYSRSLVNVFLGNPCWWFQNKSSTNLIDKRTRQTRLLGAPKMCSDWNKKKLNLCGRFSKPFWLDYNKWFSSRRCTGGRKTSGKRWSGLSLIFFFLHGRQCSCKWSRRYYRRYTKLLHTKFYVSFRAKKLYYKFFLLLLETQRNFA